MSTFILRMHLSDKTEAEVFVSRGGSSPLCVRNSKHFFVHKSQSEYGDKGHFYASEHNFEWAFGDKLSEPIL